MNNQHIRHASPLLSLFLAAFLLVFYSPGEAKGQSAMKQAPDCLIPFTLNGAGQVTSPLANYGTGSVGGSALCTFWIVAYTNVGFGALSLVVQSAPALTASTPGTWVTYAGSVKNGVNPNTSTTGAQSTLSNGAVAIPWIRVQLTTVTGTGTVFGLLQGWNSGNSGGQ